MKSVFVLLSLFALVFVAFADEQDPDVFVLGDDDFEDFINDNEFVLAEFYAPWCGHCKSLAPEYSAAATKLKHAGSPVKLAKIDATENSGLGETYKVKGYPTLKFFRDGTPTEYEGGRTASEIVAWVTKKSGPPSEHLTTQEAITKFLAGDSTKIIGYLSEKKVSMWMKLAQSGKVDDFLVGHVDDATLFGDNAENSAVLHKAGEDALTFEGKFTKSLLTKWVLKEGYPLVEELAQAVWQRSEKAKVPLLAVFAEDKVEGLLAFAKEFKGTVVVTESSQVQLAERWGASGDVVPTAIFVAWAGEQPKMTIWNEDTEEDLEIENLKKFVESALEGKYKGYTKSEPLPKNNDGPVTIIVGKNYDEIVRSEKDVLVEFYAPWCGHCKKLTPIWDELGEAFKDNANVVIAKMDATANGVPEDVSVSGFPTLIFFDKENTQTLYDGGRDLDSLKAWLGERVGGDEDKDEL